MRVSVCQCAWACLCCVSICASERVHARADVRARTFQDIAGVCVCVCVCVLARAGAGVNASIEVGLDASERHTVQSQETPEL